MSSVTLVLTRTPVREFIHYGKKNIDVSGLSDDDRLRYYKPKNADDDDKPTIALKSGRWGTLLLIRGPKVSRVSFVTSPPTGATVLGADVDALRSAVEVAGHLAGKLAAETDDLPPELAIPQYVRFANRVLELKSDGAPVKHMVEYTSMERFRSNLGARSGYVMLHAKPEPYGLRSENDNRVVKTLRPGHSGDCIRVVGGNPGPEKGILIHEAPSVGWLLGCISPRPQHDYEQYPNQAGNPSDVAFREVMSELNLHGRGRGGLFVLP